MPGMVSCGVDLRSRAFALLSCLPSYKHHAQQYRSIFLYISIFRVSKDFLEVLQFCNTRKSLIHNSIQSDYLFPTKMKITYALVLPLVASVFTSPVVHNAPVPAVKPRQLESQSAVISSLSQLVIEHTAAISEFI